MAYSYRIIGVVAVIIIVSSLGWWRWQNQIAPYATVIFFDVGQGDAIYIRTLAGDDILIDGGPDTAVVRRLGEAMPFWDRTIELMISTHPDADHSFGLVEVFEYYTVERIALVAVPMTTAIHEELFRRLSAQGTVILQSKSGDVIALGPDEQLRVVYPFSDTPVAQLERNDAAVVVEYKFFGDTETTILLPADISAAIEQTLVATKVVADVDILKVAHHGSKSSSHPDFLAAVTPEYAVIQSGQDNSYGHPHPEVLARLQTIATVLRNDQLGNITFHIDDQGYKFIAN